MQPFIFPNYELPKERIAQRPIGMGNQRANAKLLIATTNNQTISISDKHVNDLPQLFTEKDVLIINNSRVIPVRFFIDLNGKSVELFLLKKITTDTFEALARPMQKLKVGQTFTLSNRLFAQVLERTPDKTKLVIQLSTNDGSSIDEALEKDALMPIPPYIRNGLADESDRDSYQTVFAQINGSIAAPTAGLHLTKPVLDEIAQRGTQILKITLHVGIASILPPERQDASMLKTESERFFISDDVKDKIVNARKNGFRVTVVGTTCVRAVESLAAKNADYVSERQADDFASTNLFIKPGYTFEYVDRLMTNFHQPNSTHLYLVGAFIGVDNLGTIYEHALNDTYRFLSYGDSMFLTVNS